MAKTPTLLHTLKEKRARLWENHQRIMHVGLHALQPDYQALHLHDDPGDPKDLMFPPGGYEERAPGPAPTSFYQWTVSLDIIRAQIQGINYAIFLIGGGFK